MNTPQSSEPPLYWLELLTETSLVSRRVPIPEEGLLLGRDPDCGLPIDDPTRNVSGKHATLFYRSGTLWITDHSRNGTFIHTNGTFIHRKLLWRDSQPIGIGDHLNLAGVVELRIASARTGRSDTNTEEPTTTPEGMLPEPRRAEAQQITAGVLNGQCYHVVAMPNVGKTYLLTLLKSQRLRHIVGSQAQTLSFAYVDLALLDSLDARAVFALLLRAVITGVASPSPNDELYVHLQGTHTAITQAHDANEPMQRFVQAIQWVQGRLGLHRLVLLLDHADEFLESAPARLLGQLASLRTADPRPAYVLATELPMHALEMERTGLVREFVEMFRTFHLAPLTSGNDLPLWHEFSHRVSPPHAETHLRALAGGHPGLIRALCNPATPVPAVEWDATAVLTASEPVRTECATLLDGLTGEEQDALVRRARDGVTLPDPIAAELRLRGYLTGDHLFSPLLASYLSQWKALPLPPDAPTGQPRRNLPPVSPAPQEQAPTDRQEPRDAEIMARDKRTGRLVSVAVHTDWNAAVIDGLVVDLTPPQFKLWTLLLSTPGKAVNHVEIMGTLWPGTRPDNDDRVGDIYAVLKRIRERFEEKFGSKIDIIENKRSSGYRLRVESIDAR